MKEKCSECSECGYFSKDPTFPLRTYCNFYSGYVISTAEPCPYFDKKENIEYNEKMKDIYFEEAKMEEIYEETFADSFYCDRPLPPRISCIFF